MATLDEISNPFEGRKKYKVHGSPFTYFDVSKTCDITEFQAYVEEHPLSNPDNLSRLEGIEEALFYPYGDENNMYKNELTGVVQMHHSRADIIVN